MAELKPDWVVAPLTKTYAHYYLLEWRTKTKYDKMVQTAYVTAYSDEDEWQVERVPYNIPGALLYYRNQKHGASYSLGTGIIQAPSIDPKYQLLVVDMNYGPMRLGDTSDTYKEGLFEHHGGQLRCGTDHPGDRRLHAHQGGLGRRRTMGIRFQARREAI